MHINVHRSHAIATEKERGIRTLGLRKISFTGNSDKVLGVRYPKQRSGVIPHLAKSDQIDGWRRL